MICKSCKNTVPDGSIFCNWCGERLVKPKSQKSEISVPKPQKLPSGKFRIQLRAEKMSITEDTAERCITKARAIRAGFLQQKKAAGSDTLREVLTKHIDAKRSKLSPSTIRGYVKVRDNYFQSVMDTPISKISNWQRLYDEELQKYAPKTVHESWILICAAINKANYPVPTVEEPRSASLRAKHTRWLDYQQIQTFLVASRDHPGELAALLALHSLRLSEMLALSWDNGSIELLPNGKGFLHVKASAVLDEHEKLVLKDGGKTPSAMRTVPIMIDRLYTLLSSLDDKTGLLLKCNEKTPYKRINKICENAGLPKVGVHGLRHSFASLGYHLKMSSLEVKELGGWSSLDVVNNIYTHLSRQDRLNATNKMTEFYQNIGITG